MVQGTRPLEKRNAVHEMGPATSERTTLVGWNGEEPQISVPSPRQILLIEAPAESYSYLDDLLKDLPEINSTIYSETLGIKLDQV